MKNIIKQLKKSVDDLAEKVDTLIDDSPRIALKLYQEEKKLKQVVEHLESYQSKLAYQSTGPRRLSTFDNNYERK